MFRLSGPDPINLKSKRVQLDEVWSFCCAKQASVPEDKQGKRDFGDLWTWTAIDAETKIVQSWFVGGRDADHASAFIGDLSRRLANQGQLTSDGHKAYLGAVDDHMHRNVDFAMLVKIYGARETGPAQHRYSPTKCLGAEKKPMLGNPDPAHISTSYVERQNLTMRMQMRRFTRLTNAFSKKAQNHLHALSLYFMFYNFVRIHKTLRISPAIAAGVSDHLSSWEEVAEMIDAAHAKPAKRGPTKRKKPKFQTKTLPRLDIGRAFGA